MFYPTVCFWWKVVEIRIKQWPKNLEDVFYISQVLNEKLKKNVWSFNLTCNIQKINTIKLDMESKTLT